MRIRVGAVGLRPALAVHATVALAGAGAEVVPLPATRSGDAPGSSSEPAGDATTAAVHLVLVDGAGPLDPASLGHAVDGAVPCVVVHLPGEQGPARALAAALSAAAVVELPAAADWLAARVAPGTPTGPGPAGGCGALVLVGATGGAGTSTLAIAAAAAGGDCLLVDADPASPGLDLPLGLTEVPGARWPAIPSSADPLDAASLRAALPTVGGLGLLTGTPPDPADARVPAVVAVGRRHFDHVVVDAGRALPGWLTPDDVVVVVAPATLAGVVGARRVLVGHAGGRAVLALRETPWLDPGAVAGELGVERLLVLPRLRGIAEATECGDLLGGRGGRALHRLGAQAWAVAA